jgi:hypothetical protein
MSDADDVLQAELAGLLRDRLQPPPEVYEAAREVFNLRTLDAELAALTYDSLVDAEPAGVRSGDGPRVLTFEADGLTIEAEVDESPGGRRLLGQLVPPQPMRLVLESADGRVPGQADELGRFVIDLPRRPTRVRMTCERDTPVHSAWLVI